MVFGDEMNGVGPAGDDLGIGTTLAFFFHTKSWPLEIKIEQLCPRSILVAVSVSKATMPEYKRKKELL